MSRGPAASQALLRLTAVSLSFGPVEVLKGLDLEVRHGEFVALVGPSGCGKTTLLNLCSGWLRPTSGVVHRAGRVRMVFQEDGLFPWQTVGENVRAGLRHVSDAAECRRRALDLIGLVGLAGFEDHYPHQL
ncbi:MAG TPA: ATP-binding cassette domain-containing protein, partial [Vicinamibacteria bacterium]|nr:ATP-binding cassette domain-containing protein [Vicinamibacteria bacterium]